VDAATDDPRAKLGPFLRQAFRDGKDVIVGTVRSGERSCRAGEPFDLVDATTYAFNVTRCGYAEMYRAMGLGEIGHLLSCDRDAVFFEGYDANHKLARTRTIMGGASHCNFRYRYDGTGTES
jgi:hypothetical protein